MNPFAVEVPWCLRPIRSSCPSIYGSIILLGVWFEPRYPRMGLPSWDHPMTIGVSGSTPSLISCQPCACEGWSGDVPIHSVFKLNKWITFGFRIEWSIHSWFLKPNPLLMYSYYTLILIFVVLLPLWMFSYHKVYGVMSQIFMVEYVSMYMWKIIRIL